MPERVTYHHLTRNGWVAGGRAHAGAVETWSRRSWFDTVTRRARIEFLRDSVDPSMPKAERDTLRKKFERPGGSVLGDEVDISWECPD